VAAGPPPAGWHAARRIIIANRVLSIRQAEDGTVLVRCHAGCEQARVITALRSLAANSTTKIANSVAPLEFAFIWKRT
jgi:hypothetical protein